MSHIDTCTVNRFIAMWDMFGLECLFDVHEAYSQINEWEKHKTIAILKDVPCPTKPDPIPLKTLILRAKVNMQRQYEIYEFTTEMDMDEVRELFNTNPQLIVDLIRVQGHKIFSDYAPDDRKVIS